MSIRRRRHAALALGVGLVAAASARATAQSVSVSIAVVNDSISPAPAIVVQGTPGPPELGPYSLSLEVSFDPQFRAPIAVRSAAAPTASFQLDSLLPEHSTTYFRARIIDREGRAQESVRSFHVRSWLRLVAPAQLVNNVVFSRRPQFSWDSPGITLPPGPWTYEITITNTATGTAEQHQTVDETTFVPPTPLDACTSYRWSVHASVENGPPSDQVTVNSSGTFVIQTPDCPTATTFYQNFPNPFGRGELQATTCFWFDLAHRSTVSLDVYDLRSRHVRTIVPGALAAQLDSGAYGRPAAGVGPGTGGCNQGLEWDGRDAAGRLVPPGVYIAVFRADGLRSSIKMLYRGP